MPQYKHLVEIGPSLVDPAVTDICLAIPCLLTPYYFNLLLTKSLHLEYDFSQFLFWTFSKPTSRLLIDFSSALHNADLLSSYRK